MVASAGSTVLGSSGLDLSSGSGTNLLQTLQNGRGKQRPCEILHDLCDIGMNRLRGGNNEAAAHLYPGFCLSVFHHAAASCFAGIRRAEMRPDPAGRDRPFLPPQCSGSIRDR
jgi:hypothetical protein